ALPLPLQRALAGTTARAARRFDGRHSGAARRFLRQALGEQASEREIERIGLEAWRFLFTTLAREPRMDALVARDGFDAHFRVQHGPGVREALARPGGKIVIGPHLGDFEA